MTPRISIIIRCYNEEAHIGRLLHGIIQQDRDDYEIIVVDSGSTDRTRDIAARYPVKLVHIPSEEFSFGRALNLGCSHAKGDILVFASAHVYPVYVDWLTRLVEGFSRDDVAVVYGKQRGADTTKYSEHQLFKQWFPEKSNPRQDTPFCNNANCAIRRELWKDNPYDEELTGLEDLDWAKRIVEQGYSVSYSAEAEIIHVHNETPKSIYNRYFREAMALRQIYPEQTMSFPRFVGLFGRNALNDLRVARRGGVLLEEARDILMFRALQFKGAYDGMKEPMSLTDRLRRRFYFPQNGPAAVPKRDTPRIEYQPQTASD